MSGRGAKQTRIARRRSQFRDGLSVREFARTLHAFDVVDGGITLNLQTAARNDLTGTWRRVARRAA